MSQADPNPRRNADTAESLREQAAACRRLAQGSLTTRGRTSLQTLASHFDDQARKLDSNGEQS